jgi:hypothetical protein
MKKHLSVESYHKLNRVAGLAQHLYLDLKNRPLEGMHQLYIPVLFCYIGEDVSDILSELKDMGLCDDWIKKNNSDSEHN